MDTYEEKLKEYYDIDSVVNTIKESLTRAKLVGPQVMHLELYNIVPTHRRPLVDVFLRNYLKEKGYPMIDRIDWEVGPVALQTSTGEKMSQQNILKIVFMRPSIKIPKDETTDIKAT